MHEDHLWGGEKGSRAKIEEDGACERRYRGGGKQKRKNRRKEGKEKRPLTQGRPC